MFFSECPCQWCSDRVQTCCQKKPKAWKETSWKERERGVKEKPQCHRWDRLPQLLYSRIKVTSSSPWSNCPFWPFSLWLSDPAWLNLTCACISKSGSRRIDQNGATLVHDFSPLDYTSAFKCCNTFSLGVCLKCPYSVDTKRAASQWTNIRSTHIGVSKARVDTTRMLFGHLQISAYTFSGAAAMF